MSLRHISSGAGFPVNGHQHTAEELPTGTLSSDNPFAYGYSVLQTLLMSIQDIANNQYLDIKESA